MFCVWGVAAGAEREVSRGFGDWELDTGFRSGTERDACGGLWVQGRRRGGS